MGSIVLKTVAWLAFAFTLMYSLFELVFDDSKAALGCAMIGGLFWLIALRFGTDLARKERIAEAQEIERARTQKLQ